MELREYQVKNAKECNSILTEFGLVYLMHSVRTGKTLTTLEICRLQKVSSVLFITKKKAFSSILKDYNSFGYYKYYSLEIINKESLHKLESNDFDIIVLDECHQYGAFPKPGKFQKLIKQRFSKKRMIFLSGSPTPESFSQIYHQFQLSDNTPFKDYKTFYKWAKSYVDVEQKYLAGYKTNDYSKADIKLIKEVINPYCHTFTQEQAGFESSVKEEFIYCDMDNTCKKVYDILKKDLVFIGKNDTITADTGAKLMQKLHQLSGGTIKLDSGNSVTLGTHKADVILHSFFDKKIAIFYTFQHELHLLKEYFKDRITTDLSDFNTDSNKWIALQFVSGREGINLSKADVLVMYSVPFSATSYLQARDRLTTSDRKNNTVYWILANNTIDSQIYKAVTSKNNFTYTYFKKHGK